MYKLYCGDSLEIMKHMRSNWFDSVITDPPYGIEFMGRNWDYGIPGVAYWAEALRVAKPGATLLAFGGTRTHHRLMVSIEDSGWIIRDVIMWVYGSGMPHGLDISKGIDKAAGAEREVVGKNIRLGDNKEYTRSEAKSPIFDLADSMGDITKPATESAQLWDGWNTQLKPAWEPIVVAMKPVDGVFVNNALTHGVAGYNIGGAMIPTGEELARYPANVIHDGSSEVEDLFPQTKSGKLKPEHARNTPGGNGRTHGHMKGINKSTIGDSGSASRFFYCAKAAKTDKHAGLDGFFWKADSASPVGYTRIDEGEYDTLTKRQRMYGNIHTTVKPAALMEYLNRLTATPFGGVVFDPFMGSGSTGVGALANGRDFVGIDLSQEYIDIARARLDARQKLIDAEVKRPRQLSFE